MTLQFVEKRELEWVRDTEDLSHAPQGTLLVATQAALSFSAEADRYGHDAITLFAAFLNGERCWLQRAVWKPRVEHTGSRVVETILPFEQGVPLFLEQGVFAFPFPDEAQQAEPAKTNERLQSIQKQHTELLNRAAADTADRAQVQAFLESVAKAGEYTEDADQRAYLRALIHYWSSELNNKTGVFPLVQLLPYFPMA